MSRRTLKVGIVGFQLSRSWAARAHVAALRALPNDFEILGVVNSTPESSRRAALELGLTKTFASVEEMVAAREIDVVTITVRVPHHLDLVKTATRAGKHVYCEWPLGNSLAEAEEMAHLANAAGVLGVVGTQARLAPEICHLKQLVADGYVGQVLSTTLNGFGGGWDGAVPDLSSAYVLDVENGATLLTIPLGHTLAALKEVLGGFSQVSATLSVRRNLALVADSGERLPMTSPDQVLVTALLASGAPVSIHFRGGMPRDGEGFLWEINGTQGDLRLSGSVGHVQYAQLTLQGTQGAPRAFGRPQQDGIEPFRDLKVPSVCYGSLPPDPTTGNVARCYARMARDLREGTRAAPTFHDAVALHRTIAAIEEAACTGRRVHVAGQSY